MSLSASVREFFRRVFRVEEARGETVDAAVDADSVAYVEVTKIPKAYIQDIQVSIAFTTPTNDREPHGG